jgi:hypothetical protein
MEFNKFLNRVLLIILVFLANLTLLVPNHMYGLTIERGKTNAEPIKILKNYFEKKGFKTGKIEIPGLGVDVVLKENQFYKKEGCAADVYARINEIRSDFGLSVPYPDFARGYGWCGVLYAEYSGKKAYGYVVLIKKNLNTATRIYTHAHENGHFLWYVGEQEKIYQKFRQPGYVKLVIRTNSQFAELCGWIGLKRAGYNLDTCSIQYRKNSTKEKDVEKIKNLVRYHLKQKQKK